MLPSLSLSLWIRTRLIDEDGYLFIVDRSNDVTIVGGKNVVAFITTTDSQAFDVEELRDYLSDKLAKYKLPREVIIAEELPRNPSSKLVKPKLRAEFAAG